MRGPRTHTTSRPPARWWTTSATAATRASCVATTQRRAAGPGAQQHREHALDVLVVLVAGRLVEQRDARLQEQAAGDAGALLLAEARPGRGLVGDRVEGEFGEQRLVDLRAPQRCRQQHVLAHRQAARHRRVLRRERHQRPVVHVGRGPVEHGDRSRSRARARRPRGAAASSCPSPTGPTARRARPSSASSEMSSSTVVRPAFCVTAETTTVRPAHAPSSRSAGGAAPRGRPRGPARRGRRGRAGAPTAGAADAPRSRSGPAHRPSRCSADRTPCRSASTRSVIAHHAVVVARDDDAGCRRRRRRGARRSRARRTRRRAGRSARRRRRAARRT